MTALVIGIGNPLRGDDGAGPRLVELLEARGARADCLAVHQLTPELAETVAEHDPVVFVDASVRVRSLTIGPIRDEPARPLGHHATPHAVLAMAAQLFARRPHAFLVEIPAVDLGLGEHLSALAENTVEGAVEPILALLRA